jgi:hypothetical protein
VAKRTERFRTIDIALIDPGLGRVARADALIGQGGFLAGVACQDRVNAETLGMEPYGLGPMGIQARRNRGAVHGLLQGGSLGSQRFHEDYATAVTVGTRRR